MLSGIIVSVKKPDAVSYVDAAAGIGDALKAYTCFYYQAKLSSAETVVVAGATKVSANLSEWLWFWIYFISVNSIIQSNTKWTHGFKSIFGKSFCVCVTR